MRCGQAWESNKTRNEKEGTGNGKTGGLFLYNDMRLSSSKTVWGICVFLVLAVFGIFGQTASFDFVNWDDDQYVYENSHVIGGVTSQNVAWAMKAEHASNWHPLTWVSHMADCQCYRLWAGGHHLTNVVLHAATTVLLFLVFWKMTGDVWPSAFVAIVFAIHPLRAESVAWVSERKDVLSGLFFMLTLAAYVHYVQKPFSHGRYWLVVVLFALGLMAKPMLVTLPFVLLLLDYWPLGRMKAAAPEEKKEEEKVEDVKSAKRKTTKAKGVRGKAKTPPEPEPPKVPEFALPRRILLEKVPLFVLAVCSCAVTIVAQSKSMTELERLPLTTRFANAVVSYVDYLGQFVWPANLAVLYPYSDSKLVVWKVAAAAAVLILISAGALACWRRIPCLAVGWFWYIGMLVPVIGLVQVGRHAMADRYTYLPTIGLCVAVAWAANRIAPSWRYRRIAFGGLSAVIVVALMVCAWQQTAFWRNSETLWRRALDCTTNNSVAHFGLGTAMAMRGATNEAEEQFGIALKIQPDYVLAHNNLGALLLKAGKLNEASEHFETALRLDPKNANAHSNLSTILTATERYDEAIQHYEQALAIAPDNAKDHCNLGVVLSQVGKIGQATDHLSQAVEINPDYLEAQLNLGVALENQGKTKEALPHLQAALRLAEQQGKTTIVESLRAHLSIPR
jgi:tetratricopeptide (TPR) repeat protein